MSRGYWILKLTFVLLAGIFLHSPVEAQFNRATVGSGSWDNAGSWQLGVPTGAHAAVIGTTSAPGVLNSTISITGAGTRSSESVWIAGFSGTGATGVLNITAGATFNTGFVNIAEQGNSTGTLNLTNSTMTSGNVKMGWSGGAVAQFNITNSTLTSTISGEGLGNGGGSSTVTLDNSNWSFSGTGEFRNGNDGNANTKAQIILENGTLASSTNNFFRNRNATTTSAGAGSEIKGYGLISQSGGQAFQNNGRVVASGGTLTLQNFNVMTTVTALNHVEGGFYGSNGWFAQDGTGGAKLVLPGLSFPSRRTWGGGNFGNDATPDLVNSVHFEVSSGSVTGTLLGSLYSTDHADVPAGLVNPIGVWEFSGLTFDLAGALQMVIRYDNAHDNLTFDPADLKLFHYDGSTWEEILGTVDTTNRRFTSDVGEITSLSFFALAEDFQPVVVNAVPEPSTLVPALIGLVGLGFVVWRRRRMAGR